MSRHILVAALCLAAVAQAQDAPQPITLDDYGSLQSVGSPALSRDGRLVAFTLEDTIHVVPFAGGESRAVTVSTSSASNPTWAKDGESLYFLSDRSGKNQLWQLPVDTFGEAEQVTDFERGVDSLVFSPDQSQLLLRLGEVQEEADADAPKEPFVITRRQFKEDAGEGYLTERPDEHLYRLDVESGELTAVTSGEYTESDGAWSADGRRVAFVSNREADPDLSYRTDIWIVDVAAAGDMSELERVTDDERVARDPAFSPDGRWLAWLSAKDGVYGIPELMIMPADGGEIRNLSTGLDRWISGFRFSEDGDQVYVRFDNHGGAHLASISTRDGRIERLVEGDRVVSAFDMDRRGNIALRVTNANDAGNIYARRGGRLHRLTEVNDGFFASRRLGEKSKVTYTVADGTEVESFVTLPPGYEPERRYPAVLKIHGGPVGQFSWGFDFGTQFLAANGYVVLEPNPRGSTGRGQAFVEAIYRSWGITDYPDVIGAVDHAIEAGLADAERLFVTGYSYGGYMTNIVITETDRFAAAASGAGHAHLIANYGHDIYQKWYNWEFGPPTENPELYDRLSPLLRADRVTTPTLFLGGREDWNVPVLSAELFYQTLRTLGVDTKLVVYPDSHHGGWDERYEKDYLERVVAWFDKYDPGN